MFSDGLSIVHEVRSSWRQSHTTSSCETQTPRIPVIDACISTHRDSADPDPTWIDIGVQAAPLMESHADSDELDSFLMDTDRVDLLIGMIEHSQTIPLNRYVAQWQAQVIESYSVIVSVFDEEFPGLAVNDLSISDLGLIAVALGSDKPHEGWCSHIGGLVVIECETCSVVAIQQFDCCVNCVAWHPSLDKLIVGLHSGVLQIVARDGPLWNLQLQGSLDSARAPAIQVTYFDSCIVSLFENGRLVHFNTALEPLQAFIGVGHSSSGDKVSLTPSFWSYSAVSPNDILFGGPNGYLLKALRRLSVKSEKFKTYKTGSVLFEQQTGPILCGAFNPLFAGLFFACTGGSTPHISFFSATQRKPLFSFALDSVPCCALFAHRSCVVVGLETGELLALDLGSYLETKTLHSFVHSRMMVTSECAISCLQQFSDYTFYVGSGSPHPVVFKVDMELPPKCAVSDLELFLL